MLYEHTKKNHNKKNHSNKLHSLELCDLSHSLPHYESLINDNNIAISCHAIWMNIKFVCRVYTCAQYSMHPCLTFYITNRNYYYYYFKSEPEPLSLCLHNTQKKRTDSRKKTDIETETEKKNCERVVRVIVYTFWCFFPCLKLYSMDCER